MTPTSMREHIAREYRVLDRLSPALREACNNAVVPFSALAIQDALLTGKSEAEIVKRVCELRTFDDVHRLYAWAQGG